MDLNWLRDFESLARTLNFTRAAEERNITQSAFSRRIKALESWVGQPLVNRATYPVQITPAGQQFLPVALQAIARLTETRAAIRGAERGDNRFVRFSVLHTISVNYLAERIEEMQLANPELRTRVLSDSLSTCCELLIEGAVEIMLCYDHPAARLQIDDVAFARKTLLSEPLIPVAAADVARAQGWRLDQPNGPPIPYLAYEPASFLGMVVDGIIGAKPLRAQTLYVDGLVETIKRRLLRGSGFAWMPQTAIAAELAAGQVLPIGGDSWRTELSLAAFADPARFDPQARMVWEAL